MATIIRIERKDYGGAEVWCGEDADTPIYVAPAQLATVEAALGYPIEDMDIENPPDAVNTRLNNVLIQRRDAALLDRKLAAFDEARAGIEAQIERQLDRVRAYLVTHPDTTAAQIRAAVQAKLQDIFSGDVV